MRSMRFNFEEAYGVIGREYIVVHHIEQLSTRQVHLLQG